MAGGKETPRQKMIGMMYLVLTALLALNVSKSILDAFVAIEENIQVTNQNEFARGNEKKAQLTEQVNIATDQKLKALAKNQLETAELIDQETAKFIAYVDQLKMELLTSCGEEISEGKDKIVLQAYSQKEPLKPARLNLEKVNAKDNYDVAMHMFIGESITSPKGEGLKLWNSYLAYRDKITEILAKSAPSEGKAYFFKVPTIKSFLDYNDLNKQIIKAIEKSHVHPDDHEIVRKLFSSLTKQEYSTVNDVKNIHWIGKTFDHAPSVAAIASLSSLQNEVLSARADAISHIRGRIGGSDYAFNKIMPLAYGPDLVNSGDQIDIKVLMAAYDSYSNPTVRTESGTVESISNGIGNISLKAGSPGEMRIKGSIAVKTKRGEMKEMPWEKEIRVMKPMGTVSLPGLNRLYRNYENVVEAVASGFEETILQGKDVVLTKKGNQWIATPGSSRTCSITVYGKNKSDNKMVSLGTFNYNVSNMPQPSLYWGSVQSGENISFFGNGMFSKYPPEIPISANYSIVNWTVSAPSLRSEMTITGNKPTAQQEAMLKMIKKGERITVVATVRPDRGGPLMKTAGTWVYR
jgi:hypothetical protein